MLWSGEESERSDGVRTVPVGVRISSHRDSPPSSFMLGAGDMRIRICPEDMQRKVAVESIQDKVSRDQSYNRERYCDKEQGRLDELQCLAVKISGIGAGDAAAAAATTAACEFEERPG